MIKAVIFDLDGVLVDTDELHFHALNDALEAVGERPLTWNEHLSEYRALPTRTKLEMMAVRRGLALEHAPAIAHIKKRRTAELVRALVRRDEEKVEMMRLLQARGLRIAVCSNAIRESVEQMLDCCGALPFVELFLSNEDVTAAKPAPDMYLLALERLGIGPQEALVVEDSAAGVQAARAAGCRLLQVAGPQETNFYRVITAVQRGEQMTVVVPAAGLGSRFAAEGYQHPKPLIDVAGRPMLTFALDDFGRLDPHFVVLMQRDHLQRYCAEAVLRHWFPSLETVPVDGLTEGAAVTVLHAAAQMEQAGEVLIANSDQTVDADMREFVEAMRARDADGGILVFRDPERNPKWSFARTDDDGLVLEVAEKQPISDLATVGIYYFKHGSDFVGAARRMVAKDIRTNNEFYVCPVYNELIADGKRIYVHEVEAQQMHGLGTPADLAEFLTSREAA